MLSVLPQPKIDLASQAQVAILEAHARIHSGQAFFYSEFNTIGATNRDLLLVTPDTAVRIYLVFDVSTNAEVAVFFYEGTTTSADGTGVTELNRDRNSANTADLVITHTPTVTGVGTALIQYQIGSATGPPSRRAGGSALQRPEIILDQNTKYLLRITGVGSDTDISTFIDWYEI